jgi:hypothetical protein
VLTKLELTNFRGFVRHEVPFRDLTVLVGKNNAGKSSLIEALRISSIAIKAMQSMRFTDPPRWAQDAMFCRGVSPDSSTVRIDLRTAFHNYNSPPAIICCHFADNLKLTTFIGPDEELHSCLSDHTGRQVESPRDAKRVGLPSISVLPQIGPLEKTETTLHKAYIQKCLDGHLSSKHFRNQIRFNYHLYDSFCGLVHDSWPEIALNGFISSDATHGDELGLLIRERSFVAEACSFGHGLQMWLQIAWFLTRTSQDSVVILDEPDVYVHPSMQRKLIGLVRGRFAQCIVSTHAGPIIESTENSSILDVDRHAEVSMFRA